jgi:hypothetical protein
VLSVQVTDSLNLSGTLSASAASSGRGGELDLSASSLEITSGSSGGSGANGAVEVSAQQIDNLGATVVVLGGTRQLLDGAADVNVQAQSVNIDPGVTLTAPELLLVANQQIQVASGATLQASGTSIANNAPLNLPGGAAILGVSTGAQSLNASGTGTAAATLAVAQGATVSGSGAVIVGAGGGVNFSGTLQASGADVTLESNQVAIGGVPQNFSGFDINSTELPSLNGADLLIRSNSSIQVYGTNSLNVAALQLDAPGLEAAGANGQLTVTAAQVTLQDSSGMTGSSPGAGNGQLSVNAGSLALGAGSFTVGGFYQTSLSATKDLSVTGSGQLAVSGNLAVNAGVFQATGAYNHGLSAVGVLSTGSPAPINATASASAGASLTLQAGSLTLGGNFVLPSGNFTAIANGPGGAVEVLNGAALKLGGESVVFAGQQESSPGGAVNLQSLTGSVSVDAGSVIDISAGSGAAGGGSLALIAQNGTVTLAGTVNGAGGTGMPGGSFSVDAQSLDFPTLLATAGAGGLTGAWAVRERGPGDLNIGAGQQLLATSVNLTADQGSVDVAGIINAQSANGGSITLNAQDNVVLDGSLLATATAQAGRGGLVQINATQGGIYLDSGSVVNVGGESSSSGALQNTGTLWISASRNAVLSVLNADPTTQQVQLNGSIRGAGAILLEGNQAYQLPNGLLTAQDVAASSSNPYYADAAALCRTRQP